MRTYDEDVPKTQPTTRPRGPYAKSRAVQTEILDRAASAFAERGFHGASMRDIAAAAGLTPPGLTHHFTDKAELLLAVLARRDALTAERLNAAEEQSSAHKLLDVAQDNRKDSRAARLFTTMAAEAGDPNHPAHVWFKDRYARAKALTTSIVRRGQENGEFRSDISADAVAETIIAVLDGLQIQEQLDPSMDPFQPLEALLTSLRPSPVT